VVRDFLGNKIVNEFPLLETVRFLPKPILVETRQKGMTSTGISNQCHGNVRQLVDRYGGQQILGFDISIDHGEVILMQHSVWKTPEGTFVDVTQSDRDRHYLFSPMCVSTYDYRVFSSMCGWAINPLHKKFTFIKFRDDRKDESDFYGEETWSLRIFKQLFYAMVKSDRDPKYLLNMKKDGGFMRQVA